MLAQVAEDLGGLVAERLDLRQGYVEEDETNGVRVDQFLSALEHLELSPLNVDLQEVDPVDRLSAAIVVERDGFDLDLTDRSHHLARTKGIM